MKERITLFYVDEDADDLDFYKKVTGSMDFAAVFFSEEKKC